MSDEPKECPCGWPAQDGPEYYENGYSWSCECGREGPIMPTIEEAIKAWNDMEELK
jgi:hypothetical protein